MVDVRRARQAMEDALNGDIDSVDKATLRALRSIASSIDDIDVRITSISNRVLTIGGSVLATVLATAILLALRK
jgi:hypothetical protein